MIFKRCLQISTNSRRIRTIEAPRPSAIPFRNPYRAILRRDYPEPLIALLAFILGIWLWDHYFGKVEGYPPGTEEISLIKIDRDLRLADAMSGDPAWLRWVAGVDRPATARVDALSALEKLSRENSMSLPGLEAYAILKATHEKLPVEETLAEFMQGQGPLDFTETAKLLDAGSGTPTAWPLASRHARARSRAAACRPAWQAPGPFPGIGRTASGRSSGP